MKNKSVTYLLMGVVVLIWGLVLYRIFSAVSEEDPITGPSSSYLPDKKTKQLEEDTFELILDYRDPFLGKISVVSALGESVRARVKAKKQARTPLVEAPPVDWSFVVYLGAISNKQQGRAIGLFRIHGNELMMKAKESRGEITVLKITKDSAYIHYQGLKKGLAKTN